MPARRRGGRVRAATSRCRDRARDAGAGRRGARGTALRPGRREPAPKRRAGPGALRPRRAWQGPHPSDRHPGGRRAARSRQWTVRRHSSPGTAPLGPSVRSIRLRCSRPDPQRGRDRRGRGSCRAAATSPRRLWSQPRYDLRSRRPPEPQQARARGLRRAAPRRDRTARRSGRRPRPREEPVAPTCSRPASRG